MKPARGIKKLTPEEVADAIADGLRRPRPEVYVPRELGAQIVLSALMPRKVRRPMQKLLRMDGIASEYDHGARAAYQAAAGRPEAGIGREPEGQPAAEARPEVEVRPSRTRHRVVVAQPAPRRAVARQVALEQAPEARGVVHDHEVARLVPDSNTGGLSPSSCTSLSTYATPAAR